VSFVGYAGTRCGSAEVDPNDAPRVVQELVFVSPNSRSGCQSVSNPNAVNNFRNRNRDFSYSLASEGLNGSQRDRCNLKWYNSATCDGNSFAKVNLGSSEKECLQAPERARGFRMDCRNNN
jgi:hypothetical protein